MRHICLLKTCRLLPQEYCDSLAVGRKWCKLLGTAAARLLVEHRSRLGIGSLPRGRRGMQMRQLDGNLDSLYAGVAVLSTHFS